MSTFYVMEQANLFAGDDDPTASKHLTLSEIRLPALQEKYADHSPGGGMVDVEVPLGVEKLGMPFKLNGHDPDMMVQFGLNARADQTYTALGVIRDRRTGEAIKSKAIVRGRLGQVSPEAFTRGELQGFEYMVNAVVHYELYQGDRELIFWDFFTNEWRVNGADQNATENAILGIT